MTTIVCFKWVASDQDLRTDPHTHLLDTSRARREISPYDRNTIECARRIAQIAILCQINCAHPAAADPPHNFVASVQSDPGFQIFGSRSPITVHRPARAPNGF